MTIIRDENESVQFSLTQLDNNWFNSKLKYFFVQPRLISSSQTIQFSSLGLRCLLGSHNLLVNLFLSKKLDL